MTATVTVWDLRGERFMRVNGKVVASSQGKDLRSHSLLAHLPLLLHEDPQQVLIIGLGCGISLGAAQRHPVTVIDCVELSPEDIEVRRVFPELSFKLAEDAIRRGRFQQAVRLYDRLLAALPDHSVGHYRKGELHEHLRQWDAAAAAYQRTTELTPTFVAAHLRLGAIHTRNRAFDQAAATYRRGLETLPEHLGLLNNLGTTLLMQERFAEGFRVFRQALAIDSTDARVWNNLGTAFLKQRQFAEAQHYLAGAIKRRPEDATLWLKLADAYRGTGEVEKARQVLAEAPEDQRVRKMREQLGE